MIISHALAQKNNRIRWERCAATETDWTVQLLVPKRWRSSWFGVLEDFEVKAESSPRYGLVPVETSEQVRWWRYRIKRLGSYFRAFQPDVIYCIHEEGIRQLLQTIVCRRIFAPGSTLVFFSMRLLPRVRRVDNHSLTGLLRWLYDSIVWAVIRWGTDAAVCHYPDIERQMRSERYGKPILVQTQIGVDIARFAQDEQSSTVRQITPTGAFRIGFCGRLVSEKGIEDLVRAMPCLPEFVTLTVIGDGPERAMLEAAALRDRWETRLTITGFVDAADVPALMRRLDCLVVCSRTTKHWVDTFPLVVAQAMACALPVIGTRSGAIPFQLGDAGLLYDEQDVNGLLVCIGQLMSDRIKAYAIGARARARALDMFDVDALNRRLLKFFFDVRHGQAK